VCTAGDASRLTMMCTLGPPASLIRHRGARRAELAIPRPEILVPVQWSAAAGLRSLGPPDGRCSTT
jgi:hypothetical protein